MAFRIDTGQTNKIKRTKQGYLRVDAYPTRVGVFRYLNQDGTTRYELRKPESVFDADSLSSLAGIPITDDHPPVLLNPENTKEYQKGYSSDRVDLDGDYLKTSLTITDKATIEAVESGKVQLSCGYTCDVIEAPAGAMWNGIPYTHEQVNIAYNHIAIVERGRAGPEARIKFDAEDVLASDGIIEKVEQSPQSQKETMMKIVIDSKEYEISEDLAPVVQSLVDKVAASDAQQAEAKTKLDSLEGERDQLKSELEAEKSKRLDTEAIEAIINERLQLKECAVKVAPEVKLDGLDNLGIIKAIVEAKCGAMEGKSADYIRARFDVLVESAAKDTVKESAKDALKNDSAALSPREAALKAYADAWKK